MSFGDEEDEFCSLVMGVLFMVFCLRLGVVDVSLCFVLGFFVCEIGLNITYRI